VAPKIINDFTYVPLRFVAEALHAKVDYFDGEDITKAHILLRVPHVMISRYPDNAKMLTKEEAVEKLREQLIIAYENKFGTFIAFSSNEKPKEDNDKENLRYVISNLEIASENDRYFAVPVVFDFWIDKYTGEVYVFYNGQTMTINIFDPYSEYALTFAG